jgi:hypothetical protein
MGDLSSGRVFVSSPDAPALEWRLQRNRLLRSRLRKKKRLLALPVPSQLERPVNLWAYARAAPCADAGATMTAAHAVDNASNGLTAGRREQYPQGPLFKRADQTSERASLIADINALLNELDAETATETPRFEGRGSQPPALQ